MKNVLLLVLTGCTAFLMSCGDDKDSEPTDAELLAKNWVLDSYMYTELPDDYNVWEGDERASRHGESQYKLRFETGSFTRGLVFQLVVGGDTTFSESGEWTLGDGELILDPTGQGLGLPNAFDVDELTANNLVLRNGERIFLSSNVFNDTASNAYLTYVDSLGKLEDRSKYDSVLNIILQPVDLEIIYDFDLDQN